MINRPTPHPFAALKFPEIRYFIGSMAFFTLANRALAVIIGFQIYKLTHSALALGILGLVEAIPAISLSLFGEQFSSLPERFRFCARSFWRSFLPTQRTKMSSGFMRSFSWPELPAGFLTQPPQPSKLRWFPGNSSSMPHLGSAAPGCRVRSLDRRWWGLGMNFSEQPKFISF